MTKLQKQIAEKKAKIASYGDTKGKYAINKWYYYTVRTLEGELKELLDTVPCSAELDNEWANELL